MRASCIAHPTKEPLIIIRQWQIEACDGNACAAALLSFFEYWHNIKLEQSAKSRQANDVAEMHGEPRTQDETLWQFHTEAELEKGVLVYKRRVMSDAITLLEKRRFLTTGSNPVSRYKFDRTRFFLFHPEAVNAWLGKRHAKTQPRSRKNAGTSRENASWSRENASPSRENASAIPETTKETTSGERESPPPRRAAKTSPPLAPSLSADLSDGGQPAASRLPQPFLITDQMRAWAAEHAPLVALELDTETFVDTHRSKRTLSANWEAEWRIWIRRGQQYMTEEGHTSTRQPTNRPAAPPVPEKLVDPEHLCKTCYGTGMETVPGRGARRCTRCKGSKREPAEAQSMVVGHS